MNDKRIFALIIAGATLLLALSAYMTHLMFSIPEPGSDTVEMPEIAGKKESKPVEAEGTDVIKLGVSAGTVDKSEKIDAWRTPKPKPDIAASSIPEGSIGLVREIKGKVYISNSKTERKLVAKPSSLILNDEIETGEKSHVRIELADGTTISLGENSKVILDEFVYKPKSKDANNCSIRFVKGICRVLTGMITNLNPKRFKVRSRMATIGIRGCELIFKREGLREEVHVLDLSDGKSVIVETTSNGNPVMNMVTGAPLPIESSIQKSFLIEKPQKMVLMIKGKSPELSTTTPAQVRELVGQTSDRLPAKYKMNFEQGGTAFSVKAATGRNDEKSD